MYQGGQLMGGNSIFTLIVLLQPQTANMGSNKMTSYRTPQAWLVEPEHFVHMASLSVIETPAFAGRAHRWVHVPGRRPKSSRTRPLYIPKVLTNSASVDLYRAGVITTPSLRAPPRPLCTLSQGKAELERVPWEHCACVKGG